MESGEPAQARQPPDSESRRVPHGKNTNPPLVSYSLAREQTLSAQHARPSSVRPSSASSIPRCRRGKAPRRALRVRVSEAAHGALGKSSSSAAGEMPGDRLEGAQRPERRKRTISADHSASHELRS
jgi:hypothetical protein